MTVFNRLNYNFDSSLFGDAGTLSLDTQNILNLTSNNTTFNTWQINDLSAGAYNRTLYFKNPVNTVCSQLTANLNSLYLSANTIGTPILGVYGPLTNTAALLASTTLNCIIELSKFVSHTNNISGYSTNTATSTTPTFDSAVAVGNQLVMILNKTDNIANTVGVMGSLTSLFVGDLLSSNNAIVNSDNVIISSVGVTSNQITTATSHVTTLLSMLSTRRTNDWSFYQNTQQIIKDYSQLSKFGNLSDTQLYLINNFIGTPSLISKLSS